MTEETKKRMTLPVAIATATAGVALLGSIGLKVVVTDDSPAPVSVVNDTDVTISLYEYEELLFNQDWLFDILNEPDFAPWCAARNC